MSQPKFLSKHSDINYDTVFSRVEAIENIRDLQLNEAQENESDYLFTSEVRQSQKSETIQDQWNKKVLRKSFFTV